MLHRHWSPDIFVPNLGTVAFCVLAVAIAGCDLAVDRLGVPTSDVVHRAGGPEEDCQLWGASEHVEGELEIVPDGDRATTFVRTEDGERLYLVWPSGFSATMTGRGALLDDQGAPIFTDGHVVLPQVDRTVNEGTEADPIIATGFFAGTCFVPAPDRERGS